MKMGLFTKNNIEDQAGILVVIVFNIIACK